MKYHIETTDPVTGKTLRNLMSMPYVIESSENEDLVIYFESEANREVYLKNPLGHSLEHYKSHPGHPRIA